MSNKSGVRLWVALILVGGMVRGVARAEEEAVNVEAGTVVDMVLATVDGEPITISDLRAFVQSHGERLPDDVAGEGKKYLEEYVASELLEREAKGAGIGVSEDEIQAYVEEIKKQNKVDDAGLTEVLKLRGIGMDDYRAQVRSDIIRTRIMSNKVRAKINIVDEDVDRFLAENPDSAPREGVVYLHQIFVRLPEKVDSEQKKEFEARAEKLREQVKSGVSMEIVGGDDYSDLGQVHPEDLLPELAKTVSDLEPGEVSQVVSTNSGFYILKVAPSEATQRSKVDEERRAEIRKKLYEERFKTALDLFLNEELPKKYQVEYKI